MKMRLSVATKDCKVETGSIICTETPEEEVTPYFFETVLDMNLSEVFGPRDNIRSISEFYHPYTPYSGLTFQAFTYETLLGEIASFEEMMIFSPNIILYTTADRRSEWYGETFPNLAFRRHKSTIEFGLVGLTAKTTLITDNWQDKPEDEPDIQSGLIFKLSGQTKQEIELGLEARLGAKEGVTCFGNCLGPLKLQQVALQKGIGFEECELSLDNFPLETVDLHLSTNFSSDHGFDSLTINGSKTWEYEHFDFTLASGLAVTSEAFVPFKGTSLTWIADPIVLSVYFDESFQLANAAKSLQLAPDVSGLGIEGLNLNSQCLLGEKLNISVSIPTHPVDVTTSLRLNYNSGIYELDSGVITAELPADPLSMKATLAFRGVSRIVQIEGKLDF